MGASELPRDDHGLVSLNQNEPITNQSVFNAITTTINNHVSPMITTNNN